METVKFEEMNLLPETLHALADMGFEEATPIQSQAIDIILSGRDVIGQSQTGTGKTAAFGIPCLEKIDIRDRNLQAVILSPTRELAIQISEEFRKLLKYRDNIRVVPIYGGQPIDRQIIALKKGVQIIIGTPGRVMDHMERRTLKMETVKMVILDEADEMLDMGFREDIETILGKMPAERQTVLFSATMPQAILSLTKQYQDNPAYIQVAHKELTVPSIEQVYYDVKDKFKTEALCRIIDMLDPKLSLVFCNTKRGVDELVEQLQGRGYFAEGLHGDLKQAQRDMVMKKFRNNTLEILVATDVAARGIDVDDIDIVFNYDLPQDEEYYVHRIGRTARAGRTGMAVSFVVGREIYKIRDIMRFTNAKIVRQQLPSLNDIEEKRSVQFMDRVKATMEAGHLSKYIHMIEKMVDELEEFNTIDAAAALLKMSLHDESAQDFDEEAIEPEPFYDSQREKPRTKKNGRDNTGKAYDDSGMIRLFINMGKKNKIRAKDIVGALAGETGISGKVIGAIDIFDDFTFVDVPQEYVKDILTGMKDKQLKGSSVNIERAKKGKDKAKEKSKEYSKDSVKKKTKVKQG